MLRERLRAQGHEHVEATHSSTLEVTTDDWLTPDGDCIVGIEAEHAPASFDEDFVAAATDRDTRITMTLAAGGHRETIEGRGHPELTFESDRCLIARTSRHTDDRTVMVNADNAAADVDRDLVAALRRGNTLDVTLTGEPDGIDGG